ncbi:hypothetical protein EVAR_95360_1 [Eumeta japonica]|uniref:Uncharacterized protein n=1 Tax=Eumeta variegata TaxID=151549 RepID=A0A4C1U9G2_EUMVA|nr:hypothetical protein EVAR_95360_1 [Eumeta japonica]
MSPRSSKGKGFESDKIQDVLHDLEEWDMFLRERAALETGICVQIARRMKLRRLEIQETRGFGLPRLRLVLCAGRGDNALA